MVIVDFHMFMVNSVLVLGTYSMLRYRLGDFLTVIDFHEHDISEGYRMQQHS